jgi:ABC-type nitrate/sulfonate/bicarbonate transport system substrate-binding protein
VLANVFHCSMHHYLLRESLPAAAAVNPDSDAWLCVIPPPQMAEQVNRRHLDGFCVGEPWNTVAARAGYGTAVAATTDVLPAHPRSPSRAAGRRITATRCARSVAPPADRWG